MNEELSKDQTSFWGVLAFFTALFRYLANKASKKETCSIMSPELIGENKMNEKKNIKDVIELVDFGFEILKSGKEMFDGGFHPEKIGALFAIYPKGILAFENIGEVIPELADLDNEESAELVAFIISKGVLSEEATKIISKSLKVAVATYELIKEIKN